MTTSLIGIKMKVFWYVIWKMILTSCSDALIASNKEVVTGSMRYVCAFFRSKDYAIDDVSMPQILTFCACSVVHQNWALTARKCYVQMDWLVSAVEEQFTDKIPGKVHRITRVVNYNDLSLVSVEPSFGVVPLQLASEPLPESSTCKLVGFSTPGGQHVQGNSDNLLYRVWHMEGDVLQVDVNVLNSHGCRQRHGTRLSEYRPYIDRSTVCINPLVHMYLEPCSFDRGAPIVCNGSLYAVLIYERSLPPLLPLHLPTGCYGNINNSLSILATAVKSHESWIQNMLKT